MMIRKDSVSNGKVFENRQKNKFVENNQNKVAIFIKMFIRQFLENKIGTRSQRKAKRQFVIGSSVYEIDFEEIK